MLLNHFVRALQQRRWDRQAERLCGLEIDRQPELAWLLNGKVSRVRAKTEHANWLGSAIAMSQIEPKLPAIKRRLAAIVIADVVGCTRAETYASR